MSSLGRVYRGIEFIRLSDLPDELQVELKSWVDEEALLNIKTNEGLYRDCILTKNFNYWYKNIHRAEAAQGFVSQNLLPVLQFSN